MFFYLLLSTKNVNCYLPFNNLCFLNGSIQVVNGLAIVKTCFKSVHGKDLFKPIHVMALPCTRPCQAKVFACFVEIRMWIDEHQIYCFKISDSEPYRSLIGLCSIFQGAPSLCISLFEVTFHSSFPGSNWRNRCYCPWPARQTTKKLAFSINRFGCPKLH